MIKITPVAQSQKRSMVRTSFLLITANAGCILLRRNVDTFVTPGNLGADGIKGEIINPFCAFLPPEDCTLTTGFRHDKIS